MMLKVSKPAFKQITAVIDMPGYLTLWQALSVTYKVDESFKNM